MDLKSGSRSQRVLQIDGYDRELGQWDFEIAKGSLRSNDFFVTNTEYSVSKRTLACSDLDRLDEKYSTIRIGEQLFLVVSELINSWRDGPYQYVYQIREAPTLAEVYRLEATEMASGMPGKPVRTLRYSTNIDFHGLGSEGSSEIDMLRYARVNLYFPRDVDLSIDDEVEVGQSVYDIRVIQPFSRIQIAGSLRRDTNANSP